MDLTGESRVRMHNCIPKRSLCQPQVRQSGPHRYIFPFSKHGCDLAILAHSHFQYKHRPSGAFQTIRGGQTMILVRPKRGVASLCDSGSSISSNSFFLSSQKSSVTKFQRPFPAESWCLTVRWCKDVRLFNMNADFAGESKDRHAICPQGWADGGNSRAEQSFCPFLSLIKINPAN